MQSPKFESDWKLCIGNIIGNDYIWRGQWQTTPVLLPGKSHGRRSLVGCSPWDHEESDMTEWLPFHFRALEKEMATHSSECSCLENPRDGGAWWAAVYGVAQSWTRLKQLSSSSINDIQCKNKVLKWKGFIGKWFFFNIGKC